jgi:hypothetical protein
MAFNELYKLVGIEEINFYCQFCGKKETTKSFVVLNKVTGDFERFGSVCIKKALKISQKDLTIEINSLVDSIKTEYYSTINDLERNAKVIMNKYRVDNNYSAGFLPRSVSEYWILINQADLLKKECADKIAQIKG